MQVLSETSIFVLDLRVDDDELDMSSVRLDGDTLRAAVTWGASETDEQNNSYRLTSWTFRQRDSEAPWRVTGIFYQAHDGEHYSQREIFARVLANRAGWAAPPPLERLVRWSSPATM